MRKTMDARDYRALLKPPSKRSRIDCHVTCRGGENLSNIFATKSRAFSDNNVPQVGDKIMQTGKIRETNQTNVNSGKCSLGTEVNEMTSANVAESGGSHIINDTKTVDEAVKSKSVACKVVLDCIESSKGQSKEGLGTNVHELTSTNVTECGGSHLINDNEAADKSFNPKSGACKVVMSCTEYSRQSKDGLDTKVCEMTSTNVTESGRRRLINDKQIVDEACTPNSRACKVVMNCTKYSKQSSKGSAITNDVASDAQSKERHSFVKDNAPQKIKDLSEETPVNNEMEGRGVSKPLQTSPIPADLCAPNCDTQLKSIALSDSQEVCDLDMHSSSSTERLVSSMKNVDNQKAPLVSEMHLKSESEGGKKSCYQKFQMIKTNSSEKRLLENEGIITEQLNDKTTESDLEEGEIREGFDICGLTEQQTLRKLDHEASLVNVTMLDGSNEQVKGRNLTKEVEEIMSRRMKELLQKQNLEYEEFKNFMENEKSKIEKALASKMNQINSTKNDSQCKLSQYSSCNMKDFEQYMKSQRVKLIAAQITARNREKTLKNKWMQDADAGKQVKCFDTTPLSDSGFKPEYFREPYCQCDAHYGTRNANKKVCFLDKKQSNADNTSNTIPKSVPQEATMGNEATICGINLTIDDDSRKRTEPEKIVGTASQMQNIASFIQESSSKLAHTGSESGINPTIDDNGTKRTEPENTMGATSHMQNTTSFIQESSLKQAYTGSGSGINPIIDDDSRKRTELEKTMGAAPQMQTIASFIQESSSKQAHTGSGSGINPTIDNDRRKRIEPEKTACAISQMQNIASFIQESSSKLAHTRSGSGNNQTIDDDSRKRTEPEKTVGAASQMQNIAGFIQESSSKLAHTGSGSGFNPTIEDDGKKRTKPEKTVGAASQMQNISSCIQESSLKQAHTGSGCDNNAHEGPYIDHKEAALFEAVSEGQRLLSQIFTTKELQNVSSDTVMDSTRSPDASSSFVHQGSIMSDRIVNGELLGTNSQTAVQKPQPVEVVSSVVESIDESISSQETMVPNIQQRHTLPLSEHEINVIPNLARNTEAKGLFQTFSKQHADSIPPGKYDGNSSSDKSLVAQSPGSIDSERSTLEHKRLTASDCSGIVLLPLTGLGSLPISEGTVSEVSKSVIAQMPTEAECFDKSETCVVMGKVISPQPCLPMGAFTPQKIDTMPVTEQEKIMASNAVGHATQLLASVHHFDGNISYLRPTSLCSVPSANVRDSADGGTGSFASRKKVDDKTYPEDTKLFPSNDDSMFLNPAPHCASLAVIPSHDVEQKESSNSSIVIVSEPHLTENVSIQVPISSKINTVLDSCEVQPVEQGTTSSFHVMGDEQIFQCESLDCIGHFTSSRHDDHNRDNTRRENSFDQLKTSTILGPTQVHTSSHTGLLVEQGQTTQVMESDQICHTQVFEDTGNASSYVFGQTGNSSLLLNQINGSNALDLTLVQTSLRTGCSAELGQASPIGGMEERAHLIESVANTAYASSSGLDQDPLLNELLRIRKEEDSIVQMHDKVKMLLKSAYENEIEKLQKKYDTLFQDSEAVYVSKKKDLDLIYDKLSMNHSLARNYALNFSDNTSPASQGRLSGCPSPAIKAMHPHQTRWTTATSGASLPNVVSGASVQSNAVSLPTQRQNPFLVQTSLDSSQSFQDFQSAAVVLPSNTEIPQSSSIPSPTSGAAQCTEEVRSSTTTTPDIHCDPTFSSNPYSGRTVIASPLLCGQTQTRVAAISSGPTLSTVPVSSYVPSSPLFIPEIQLLSPTSSSIPCCPFNSASIPNLNSVGRAPAPHLRGFTLPTATPAQNLPFRSVMPNR